MFLLDPFEKIQQVKQGGIESVDDMEMSEQLPLGKRNHL